MIIVRGYCLILFVFFFVKNDGYTNIKKTRKNEKKITIREPITI